LKVFFNFHCQKTENKKFFFQQILLIFAELLIKIFTNIFCNNFYNEIPLESLFKNILK